MSTMLPSGKPLKSWRHKLVSWLVDRLFGNDPETSHMLKATWTLAGPVVLEQALAMISHVVDMAMVGRLGEDSVAAIGLSMQPFFLINAVFMGLSVGTTALFARASGANNQEEAGKIAGQSLVIAVVFGLVVSLFGYLSSDWIVTFMKAEPAVREIGSSYVRAMMLGMPMFFVFTIAAGALRGSGDTRTPMLINFGLNILHLFTNYLLIFGNLGFPALGVAGAGVSTSISRITGGIAILVILTLPRGKLTVVWKDTLRKIDWTLLKRVLNVGIPAMFERVLTSTGQISYSRQVAGLGTQAYAAHSLALNVESFSYMPGMGFATAATTLVGQKLGGKDPEGAEKVAMLSIRMAIFSMGTMGLLFFLLPSQFLRIFTDDVDVILRGVPLLKIVAFTQIPEAVGFVIPGVLRGAGDTRIAMYVTVLGVWCVRVGLTYLLMRFWNMGLTAAWIAMLLDWLVRSALYLARLKRGKWKSIEV